MEEVENRPLLTVHGQLKVLLSKKVNLHLKQLVVKKLEYLGHGRETSEKRVEYQDQACLMVQ
jgi:hypothetical protein